MPHFTIPRRPGFGDPIVIEGAANFYDAINSVLLSGADLRGAKLSGADLSGADLREADLREADLSGAKLSFTYLREADLSGADLSGSDLRGADLPWANLSGAKLSGAKLSGTDLRGADLSGADLNGADLRRANLHGATINGDTLSRLVASAHRSDGCAFHAFELKSGVVKVKADCRWLTIAEYRARIASEYPGTDKAEETGRILDQIEERAAELGIPTDKETV